MIRDGKKKKKLKLKPITFDFYTTVIQLKKPIIIKSIIINT